MMMKKGLILAFMAVSMMIGGNAIAQNKKECPKSKTECPQKKGVAKKKTATSRNLVVIKRMANVLKNQQKRNNFSS